MIHDELPVLNRICTGATTASKITFRKFNFRNAYPLGQMPRTCAETIMAAHGVR